MAKAAKNSDGEREALIEAVVAETVAAGYANLSAGRIAARADLPIAAFDAAFPDPRSALVAAYEALSECFFGRLVGACETHPNWPLKVKVGIGLTLDLAAAEPIKARFLVQESLSADPALARQAMESQDRLARLLAPGENEVPKTAAPPSITGQALVAGLAGVISARLADGEAQRLPALAPELVELTLLPYLGAEAAAAVAIRPRRSTGGP